MSHPRACPLLAIGAFCLTGLLLTTNVDAKRPKHLPLKEEAALNAGLGTPPKGLDRSTPNRAWSAFMRLCGLKNWEMTANLLNLGDIKETDQRVLGAATARKLCEVLKVSGQTSASGLDDTKLGPLVDDKPTNYVIVAEIPDPASKGEVWLRRIKDLKTDSEVWVVTRRTLSSLGDWYAHLVKKEEVVEGVAMVNSDLGKLPADYDASSPRAAAMTFTKQIKAGKYDEAARLLDLRNHVGKQKSEGPRLARRLSLVLERLHPGGFGHLNNDPRGAPEKDVPDNEEVMLQTKLPDGASFQVRLARTERKDGSAIWLVSSNSVDGIDALYNKVGYGWAGDLLPSFFFQVKFAKIQLWQWIGLLIGLLAALIFGYLLSFFTRRVLMRLAKMTKWEWDDDVVAATRGPLILLFFALGLIVVSGVLAFTEGPQGVILRIAKLLVVLGIGWFLIRTVDIAGLILHSFFERREDEMGMAMVPVARRIAKPIMVLVVGIVALQNAGVDVTGLLAGLGIGGLALAMAAKTTVENMLGGITIAFDRPFKVGETIQIGDVLGDVEEVGLRSTRVRTLDRTVVTIPNGQVVDSRIENLAKRDRRRLVFTIGVQYDTTLDQMRYIIDEIKRLLVAHDTVWQDSFRVRFSGFGDSALEIQIYCFIDTTNFNLFTAVREELFMHIAEIVTAAGAEFAFPSQTIYTGKAADADAEKAVAAARLIEERSSAGELTIPEIPDEVREKLQSSTRG